MITIQTTCTSAPMLNAKLQGFWVGTCKSLLCAVKHHLYRPEWAPLSSDVSKRLFCSCTGKLSLNVHKERKRKPSTGLKCVKRPTSMLRSEPASILEQVTN